MTANQQWLHAVISAAVANAPPPAPPTVPAAVLNFLDNFSNASTPWLGTFVDNNGGYPASHLYGPWRDDLAAATGTASQAAGILTLTYDGSGDQSPIYQYKLNPTDPMYVNGDLYLQFVPLSAGTTLSGKGITISIGIGATDYATFFIGENWCSVDVSISGTTVSSGNVATDNWASVQDDLVWLELTATAITLSSLASGVIWTSAWTRPALNWNVRDILVTSSYGAGAATTMKMSALTAFVI